MMEAASRCLMTDRRRDTHRKQCPQSAHCAARASNYLPHAVIAHTRHSTRGDRQKFSSVSQSHMCVCAGAQLRKVIWGKLYIYARRSTCGQRAQKGICDTRELEMTAVLYISVAAWKWLQVLLLGHIKINEWQSKFWRPTAICTPWN